MRIAQAVVCVPIELLRRPTDRMFELHQDMLRHLVSVASLSTLQHAIATVRAAHTLCGTSLLDSVTARVDVLWHRARGADEAHGRPMVSSPRPESRPPLRSHEPSVGECYPTACGLRIDAR